MERLTSSPAKEKLERTRVQETIYRLRCNDSAAEADVRRAIDKARKAREQQELNQRLQRY